MTLAPARPRCCGRSPTCGSTSRPKGAPGRRRSRRANEMVEQVGQLPEFRDEQVNLAELIIKIGEGLADRARQGADAKALAEAETVVALHARVAGEPAPAFLNRSRLPAKLTEARAAVRKAQVRAQALAAMDQAIKDGCALAGLRRARRPGRAVCRPGSRQGPGRADDGRQRADPQGGHRRNDSPAGRAREPRRSRWARRPAWCFAAPRDDSPKPAGRRDRLCPGRRVCLRDRRLDRRAACGSGRWAWPRPSCRSRFPATRRPWRSTPGTTSWSGSMPGPAPCKWRLALGEPVGRPAAGAGQPARPGAAQRKAAADRARVGRARVDRQPGPAAGSLAGARRVGPAPLHSGPPGLPVRAGARAACRASRSCISAMPTRRSPALRRDWAGSWSSPKTIRCTTAGCTSWCSTRTG